MLHLRTFGALDLRTSDGVSAGPLLAHPRSTALMVYLLLARPGAYLSRDTLCVLFWPDADHEHARGALSQTLSRIRRDTNQEIFEARGRNELRVTPGTVACDVIAFDDAIAAGDHVAALELYRGPFLHGFHVSNAPGFEAWAEAERDRLRMAAAGAARAVALEHLGWNRLPEAWKAAARALALAPEGEAVAGELVRAMAEAGDRAGAVALFDAWAGKLALDLELEPTEELQAMADELRDAAAPAPLVVLNELISFDASDAAPPVGSDEADASSSALDDAADRPGRRRLVRRFATAALAGVVLLLVGLGLAKGRVFAAEFPVSASGRIATGLAQGDWLVVTDFDVPGGDSALALAFQTILVRDVESAGYASVVGAAGTLGRGGLDDVLGRMRLPPGTRITPELACEVAEREGAAGVLAGRVLPLGTDYVLTASVMAGPRCEEAIRTSTVASFDELSPAVTGLSREIRSRLGESRASIRSSPPLPPITAAYVEAVRAVQRYVSSPELWNDEERGAAQLLRALQIDPDCAFGHFALAVHYQRVGRFDRAVPHILRAYELRSQLPRGGRLGMEAIYQRHIASNPAAAIATVQTLIADYPTMADATMPFLAETALWMGDGERALAVSLEHLGTGPTGFGAHLSLGRAVSAAWMLGRIALADSLEAARTGALLAAGVRDDPAATLLHRLRHRDWKGAEALCAGQPQWDRCGYVDLARGRLAAAARRFEGVLAGEPDEGPPWTRAAALAGLAHAERLRGRPDTAWALLEQAAPTVLSDALARPALHLNRFLVCTAAAELGRSRELAACAIETEDPAEWDADPSMMVLLRSGAWSRRLLAVRALEAGDPALALARARAAVHANFDNPGLVDHLLHGLAFDALGRPDSAATHFLAATRLDRDPEFPTTAAILFPLAPVHLRIAELADAAGDASAALEQYATATELWSGAGQEPQP